MIFDTAGLMAVQIKIRMVRQIHDRILIALAVIIKNQLFFVRYAVPDAYNRIPRKILIPVRTL